MKYIDLSPEQNAILRELMSVAPEGGVDIAAMRRAIRVIDALEANEGVVALEDADFDCLKARFLEAKFRVVSRDILAIADKLQ